LEKQRVYIENGGTLRKEVLLKQRVCIENGGTLRKQLVELLSLVLVPLSGSPC
jgi:hypothetical protein